MMRKPHLSLFTASLLTAALVLLPLPGFAKESSSSDRAYNHGYDDGYEDGYDDAMDDCPCPPKPLLQLSGFYAGLELGVDSLSAHRKIFDLNDQIATLNSSATGRTGDIFAGYGRPVYKNFYLGGEAYLGKSCASGSDSFNNYYGQFSSGYSYGASIRPGYQTNSGSLMYLRFGVNQTRFEAQDTATNINTKTNNWATGWSFGFGGETQVYKNFGMRLEYNHIDYNSFTNTAPLGSNNSATDNRTTLGVLYHFNF